MVATTRTIIFTLLTERRQGDIYIVSLSRIFRVEECDECKTYAMNVSFRRRSTANEEPVWFRKCAAFLESCFLRWNINLIRITKPGRCYLPALRDC